MPFLAEETIPIPNKDILSWTFDNPQYDQDKPVSEISMEVTDFVYRGLTSARFT